MKAYGTGLNSHGELCPGVRQKPEAKTLVPIPFARIPEGIARAYAGYNSTWVWMEDGTPWAFGGKLYGQMCGNYDTGQPEYGGIPQWIPNRSLLFGLKPREISYKGPHGAAILLDNRVVTWGTSAYGVSGDGEFTAPKAVEGEALNRAFPVLVGREKNGVLAEVPQSIYSGSHNVYVITVKGRVIVWGNNGSGQCGLGFKSLAYQSYPVFISSLKEVTAVAPGNAHALFLSGGRVYACGNNSKGQCGIPGDKDIYTPTLVPGLPNNIVSIYAGAESMAIGANGILYRWGPLGKLGEFNTVPELWINGGVTAAASGYTPHGHAIVEGEWVGWGVNAYGEVGDGTDKERFAPTGTGLRGLSPNGNTDASEFHAVVVG